MTRIGLTGGPGTGKSTVARRLVEKGMPVVDTDDLARELTRPGQPILGEIAAALGADVLDENGALRRAVLASRVFGDAAERRRLEAILHPPIRREWMRRVQAWRQAGQPAACVVIPLLYETGAETEFDFILCTGCGPATQRARLRERGWSDEEIDRRISSQLPLKTKMQRANFVIWTEGAMDSTVEQLDRVLNHLGLLFPPAASFVSAAS